MNPLRKANLEALSQVEALISSLPPGTPGDTCVYAQSGIGRHVRHMLDHYQVLRNGLLQGHVDYNLRNRDSQVERSALLALTLIGDLRDWLLHTTDLEQKTLRVVSEVSSLETCSVAIDSNVERELHYLAYHTIHHVAYCSLIARQQGQSIDPAIGLAPGTATWQRSQVENRQA